MKFFIAFVALFAVAVASPTHKPIDSFNEELQAIVDAINHPSTDPATAILLQEQLESILAQLNPEISVGPAIIENEYEPISVGPAIVEGEYEPISVGPAIVDEVAPIPVIPPKPESSSLVQIIINVRPGLAGNPVTVEGIDTIPVIPEPVQVVEQPEIMPSPVIVVDQPIPVEPVLVSPIAPAPVVVLPDILN